MENNKKKIGKTYNGSKIAIKVPLADNMYEMTMNCLSQLRDLLNFYDYNDMADFIDNTCIREVELYVRKVE